MRKLWPASRVGRVVVSGVTALVRAAGGGTAWALDHYVVDHVQIADVDASEAAHSGTASQRRGGETTVTGTTYASSDATVTIARHVTGSGSATVTYYVADVVLTDATRLRSAFADNRFGTNIVENTSQIAADNDAVFAINGDYHGFRDTGIVIRNGVVYRDKGTRQGARVLP
ncbi:hypothetical protein OHA72_25270 [Dactylosporangium sp. NBC_01737]|uniref:hypothetical protein n=1 Tax=Dactylosporangium sp. NBC_01737 TaxID=2975959 RepID=UPI002E0EEBAE|nr:hypothetical protein OHA72_25270 [Dactylosporangium sp. NBC_01737]